MKKETFEFLVDQEATMCYTYRYRIKATSLEKATAIVKEAFKRGGLDEIGLLDDSIEGWDAEPLYEADPYPTGKQTLCTEDGTFICDIE